MGFGLLSGKYHKKLDKPEDRINGRQVYLPLLPDLIVDPEEIWVGWSVSEISGRVALRRRYAKRYDLGNGKSLGLISWRLGTAPKLRRNSRRGASR